MPSPGSVKFVYVPADPHEPLQQWEAGWADEQGELECVLNRVKARGRRVRECVCVRMCVLQLCSPVQRAGVRAPWEGVGRHQFFVKCARNPLKAHPPPTHHTQAHFKATKPAKTEAQLAAQKAAFLASVPEADRGNLPPGILDAATGLGMVENVALLSNAPDHGFIGVNLYCDDEGQVMGLPRNARACEFAACAGKPLDVCGDAFLARVMDSDAEFARLDLTLDDVSSSAPWVKAAAAQNAAKRAGESADVRLARAGVKAGVNDLGRAEKASTTASVKPAVAAPPPACPHRADGNAAFKEKRWSDAVAAYTRAADAAPPSSPAWIAAVNNRAAARLAAGDAAGVAADAGAVLDVAPADVKALLRRGSAREALGDGEGAASDYGAALEVEPGNGQARAGLARVKK